MRIVHFSDTHLGHRFLAKVDHDGRNVREQDIYAAFRAAIEKVIALSPDAVVHAGDLFDSFHPSTEALAVALDGLARLRDAGIPLVLVSGNHSTPRFRGTTHVFSLLERFGYANAVWREPRVVKVDTLAITAIPHQPDAEGLAAALRGAKPDPDAAYNVLVLHAELDALPKVGASEAGSLRLDPQQMEEVRDFDYIAFGHFHEYKALRVNASYSGSLERLGFDDRSKEKVIVEVDLAAGSQDPGWITRHPIPTRLVKTLEEIDGLATDDLTEAVLGALDGVDLDGAVLRCPIRSVTQDQYRGLDQSKVRRATKACLHFELKPQYIGPANARPRSADDLRAYVVAATPVGIDVEEVLRRAEDLLAEAASGIAE